LFELLLKIQLACIGENMMNSELTGVIQFAITYLIQPIVNKR